MALSREGRQDRAEAGHDLLERTHHLHLRRIRRAPRGPHGHHRNRRPLVYPAGPFGRRSLRPGEVRTQIALGGAALSLAEDGHSSLSSVLRSCITLGTNFTAFELNSRMNLTGSRNMNDSTIKKVSEKSAPKGTMGQTYLFSGQRVAIGWWDN